MRCPWNALSLALSVIALGVLSIAIASCGSSNASYRIIDAIAAYDYSGTGGFDIQINGGSAFTGVLFGNIDPAGADAYQSIGSGSNTFTAFAHGTTTSPVISSSFNFGSRTQYTVMMMGNSPASGAQFPYVAQPFTDDNASPTSGNFEFRIIDASTNLPSSVDVYIVGSLGVVTGPNPPSPSATVSYGQASGYISNAAGPWYFVVCSSGSHIPLFYTTYTPGALQIRTLVLVDGTGGYGYATQPLEFDDLN